MAVIIDSHKPNFSVNSLKLLKNFYYMKVEEVVAMGIESFRHEQVETFFKNSLYVVFCEKGSDSDYRKDAKKMIATLWGEVYPWLLATYRIYPPLKNLVVHHIEYKEEHIRIYAYTDLP